MSEWPLIYRCTRCGGGHSFGALCSQSSDDDKRRHDERIAVAIDIAAVVELIRQGDVFAPIDGMGVPTVVEQALRRLLDLDTVDVRAALVLAVQALRNLTMGDPDRLYGALGLDGAVADELLGDET